MVRRLAIIPARGGSKRIPNKNVRDFCGKPMIAHVLTVAMESGLFDTVHVSTESDEISKIASTLGCLPEFKRPENLADDMTPIMPVLKHVVTQYQTLGQEFDQIWLLMACSPLIDVGDLRGMLTLYEQHGAKTPVVAVGAFPSPIERGYQMEETGKLTPLMPETYSTRTQDLETKYFNAGSCVIFPQSNVIESEGAGSNADLIGFVLPKHKAIDIDDEEDWKIAEAIFQSTQNRDD